MAMGLGREASHNSSHGKENNTITTGEKFVVEGNEKADELTKDWVEMKVEHGRGERFNHETVEK